MGKIKYTGIDDIRILDAADLKKVEVEGFKKTEFKRFEPTEVSSEVIKALLENPGLFGPFAEVIDEPADEELIEEEEPKKKASTGAASTGSNESVSRKGRASTASS